MKAVIYARKSVILLLIMLPACGCSKPFTPLTTALVECTNGTKVTGDGLKYVDAFERCMHDKGWVSVGHGQYEQAR